MILLSEKQLMTTLEHSETDCGVSLLCTNEFFLASTPELQEGPDNKLNIVSAGQETCASCSGHRNSALNKALYD